LPLNATNWEGIENFCNRKVYNSKTIRKYINLLYYYVKQEIIHEMESVQHIGMILDGLSSNSIHMVGLFAAYIGTDGSKKKPLLRLSPLSDRTTQSADEHVYFIKKSIRSFG
jgi:hypothetical protein